MGLVDLGELIMWDLEDAHVAGENVCPRTCAYVQLPVSKAAHVPEHVHRHVTACVLHCIFIRYIIIPA